MRADGRAADEMRKVKATLGFSKFAEGSCLIEIGDTMVLCNASVEDKVPPHVTSGGWVTAEYSMLPRANRERSKRDVSKLKLSPRSAEIQRFIGRSLRCAVDLEALGTHTASVTGGFIALTLACRKLLEQGKIEKMPVRTYVSGISAGIVRNEAMLDLCYEEDSRALVDLNCIMTAEGDIVELQATGEGRPFSIEEQRKLLALCRKGNAVLAQMQRRCLGGLE